jgi:hypothetical protein
MTDQDYKSLKLSQQTVLFMSLGTNMRLKPLLPIIIERFRGSEFSEADYKQHQLQIEAYSKL